MDDDEVVLHALDVLPQLGHELVVSSALAKAFALQGTCSVGEPSITVDCRYCLLGSAPCAVLQLKQLVLPKPVPWW